TSHSDQNWFVAKVKFIQDFVDLVQHQVKYPFALCESQPASWKRNACLRQSPGFRQIFGLRYSVPDQNLINLSLLRRFNIMKNDVAVRRQPNRHAKLLRDFPKCAPPPTPF